MRLNIARFLSIKAFGNDHGLPTPLASEGCQGLFYRQVKLPEVEGAQLCNAMKNYSMLSAKGSIWCRSLALLQSFVGLLLGTCTGSGSKSIAEPTVPCFLFLVCQGPLPLKNHYPDPTPTVRAVLSGG